MHVQKYDSLHCIILEWDNMVFCARLFWAATSFQPQNNKVLRNIHKSNKYRYGTKWIYHSIGMVFSLTVYWIIRVIFCVVWGICISFKLIVAWFN